MDKILLKITGSQRIDNQKDKLELTTIGSFEEKKDAYIINYKEEQEPPEPPVSVSVKISKDEKSVVMTRSGANDSCLVIEKSRRNLCNYGTQFGDILMGISGHTVDSEYDGSKGKFLFTYDIDINGALASKNEVIMTFRKN